MDENITSIRRLSQRMGPSEEEKVEESGLDYLDQGQDVPTLGVRETPKKERIKRDRGLSQGLS